MTIIPVISSSDEDYSPPSDRCVSLIWSRGEIQSDNEGLARDSSLLSDMMITYLLIGLALAAALQAGTGFGFSLLAMPLLLLAFPAANAVQLNLMLSMALSLGMIRHISNQVDRRLLSRMLVGGAIAFPFALPLVGIDGPIYRMGIGAGLLLLVLLQVVSPKISRTPMRDYATGGASSVMTLVFGMPGPPLMLYMSASNTDKAAVRGTALAFFLLAYAAGLAAHFFQNGLEIDVLHSLAWLLPVVVLGTWIGRWAYPKLTQTNFRIVLWVVLVVTGLAMTFDAWGRL